MATYECASRTNYFHVTDEEKYAQLYSGLYGNVVDFTKTAEDGSILHGFGAYSSVCWSSTGDPEDDPGDGFDEFVQKLQAILPKNEAFIYVESGNENLRYVTGHTIVCTAEGISFINLADAALARAREMLGEPTWSTQIAY